jgi:hypothetical protein
MFQKNKIKNHGVANELFHKRVKFQFQIQKILGYTKKQNLLTFRDLKYAYPDPHICYFCLAQNFLFLKSKFCTFVGQFIGYTIIFFLFFFEAYKCDFYFF